jgi:hypothetical protein
MSRLSYKMTRATALHIERAALHHLPASKAFSFSRDGFARLSPPRCRLKFSRTCPGGANFNHSTEQNQESLPFIRWEDRRKTWRA